jgi:hypothetical protein
MNPAEDINCILDDCFLAVGQAVGRDKTLELEALRWWHARYRALFLAAMGRGNSWAGDRARVTAVGRFLGQRARHHAGGRHTIDMRAAELASADVESGCQMNAQRESGLPAPPLYES